MWCSVELEVIRCSLNQEFLKPKRKLMCFPTQKAIPISATRAVALAVPIPASAKKVELRAIISGHGGATDNCAEFCNHQHEFTVGGKALLKDYPEVGDQEGCLAQIGQGALAEEALFKAQGLAGLALKTLEQQIELGNLHRLAVNIHAVDVIE